MGTVSLRSCQIRFGKLKSKFNRKYTIFEGFDGAVNRRQVVIEEMKVLLGQVVGLGEIGQELQLEIQKFMQEHRIEFSLERIVEVGVREKKKKTKPPKKNLMDYVKEREGQIIISPQLKIKPGYSQVRKSHVQKSVKALSKIYKKSKP